MGERSFQRHSDGKCQGLGNCAAFPHGMSGPVDPEKRNKSDLDEPQA